MFKRNKKILPCLHMKEHYEIRNGAGNKADDPVRVRICNECGEITGWSYINW